MARRPARYEDLTYLGQLRRLNKLARNALAHYGLGDARLTLIQHAENTTYRVGTDADGAGDGPVYVPGRFLLRVHRPSYQREENILSELAWLKALREDGEMPVPEPVLARDGRLLVEAGALGMEPRKCSFLRWMRGRFCGERCGIEHYESLGRRMAQLHEHTLGWTPPEAFVRRHWNWEGLFGDNAGFHKPAEEVWELVPDAYRGDFSAISEMGRDIMATLGSGPEVYGLIHADLHFGNVLFHQGEARPIDFDDSGYAHWVYDFAATLGDERDAPEWEAWRDALFSGYRAVRPLPQGVPEYLDFFVAARLVSVMLWAVDVAQVNAKMQQSLPRWLEWAGGIVDGFLS